jgi:purine-binding chemotaxis protein CheW
MTVDGHKQYCTFAMGDDLYGIEVGYVQEVLRAQKLTDVPRAPARVRGLMNLRGRIVLVMDLALQLGLPRSAHADRSMNIVLRQDGGTTALLVDRICEVVDVPDAEFEPPPATLRAPLRTLIRGAYKLSPKLLLVLMPSMLLTAESDSHFT